MVNLSSSLPPKIEFKFSDDICRSAARYTPHNWNCLSQQVNYWLINVCSEIPFETVIFITALHCVPALHVVIWCWATGQVSHTFMTSENAVISVNFKLLLFFSAYDFILLLLCSIHNYTWTTTTSRTPTTTTRMRIKRFMLWWGLLYVIRKDLLWSKCVEIVRWSIQISSQIYPPYETATDRRWSLHWSMSSMRAHSKQMASGQEEYYIRTAVVVVVTLSCCCCC